MLQFTERSRSVVETAEAKARAAGSPAVSVAHLAVALLELGNGVAHRALIRLGTDPAALLDTLAAAGRAGDGEAARGGGPGARVPFAPDAKSLLEAAAHEAEALGHQYLGSEHLLIALAASKDPAGDLFRGAGITREAVQRAVREVLGSP